MLLAAMVMAASVPAQAAAKTGTVIAAAPGSANSDDPGVTETANPGNRQSTGAKSAETKTTEAKSAETKTTEAKLAETKTTEAKSAETKSAEAKSEETKSVEVSSVEAKSEETKSAEVSSVEAESTEDSAEILSAKEALFGDLLSDSSNGPSPVLQEEAGLISGNKDDNTASVPGEETEKNPDESFNLDMQGILSVPDHPLAVTADKMVFIGDSRTVAMMNAVNDDSIWCCKVSMGYNWMATEGVPAVDGYIDGNTAVIIWMGVNDPFNISNYIGYTNEKAAEWAARGATTYYVSVGPVTADPYVTNAEIESFNAALQANLSGVYYIDIYSYLMANGFSTVDGTHYPDSVSIAIYNYIIDHLEENRSGIWG